MTKTEILRRSRSVRKSLGDFNRFQDREIRAWYRATRNLNPEYVAMNHLLVAQKELNTLVADLRAEGYGQEYEA